MPKEIASDQFYLYKGGRNKAPRIHTTSPLSAQEILDALNISDEDVAEARRAIEATLPKSKRARKSR